MKDVTNTLHKLAVDGITLLAVLALTMSGLWGLASVDAPLFTTVVYVIFTFPLMFSTVVHFARDVRRATHVLIA